MSAFPPALIGRYLVVGLFNTAVSYSFYLGLLYAGVAYPVASLGSLLGGIFLSFVTLGRYVFTTRVRGRFTRFLMVWTGLYFLNIGLLNVLIGAGLSPYTAGLVAAPPTIGLAFLLQRFLVFPSATMAVTAENVPPNTDKAL